MLRTENLARPWLEPVNIRLPEGRIGVVMGRSGSGKTLLARAIVDLDPNGGEVWWKDVRRGAVPAPEWRRLVGYVPAESGWWADRVLRQEPELVGFPEDPLTAITPTFEGDQSDYPLHLYPFLNIGLSDGRGANQPWLQELPDPMTTARWETWVEVNPETAHKLGVEDNDVVNVVSPYGQIVALVVVFPGIRPDVVAVPVGQGHTDYGRFARERGGNPLGLLGPAVDPQTGAFAWGATRVRLEPVGRKQTLARLESLDGEGRETIR